jgi:hypothetical protein
MAHSGQESYRDRVIGAYKAAWVLKLMAWVTVAIGAASFAVTGIGYVLGIVSGQVAFATIVGTALGTILTGGTAYASATNLGIAGARLEIAIDTAEGSEPQAPIDLAL